MSSVMTFKMSSKLYTDEDLEVDRVFEIKIRDLRARKEIKQKSFSIFVKKGTKDNEYSETERLKDKLQKAVKTK